MYKHKGIRKSCAGCGIEFSCQPSKVDTNIFCSAKCSWKYKKTNHKKRGEYKPCQQCGKETYVQPSSIKYGRGKYCSKECNWASKYKNELPKCTFCNTELTKRDHNQRGRKKLFCNDGCKENHQRKTRDLIEYRRKKGYLQSLSRGTIAPRRLRESIFLVKQKQCEICGYSEYDFCLDLHHKDKNPRNNNIDNIAILCCICHRKLHKNLLSLNDIKVSISIVKEAENILSNKEGN